MLAWERYANPAVGGDLLREHIVSPAPTTERLQSIQRMVADQLGDALPLDFSASVLQSIPVQAGGLYPISDVWYIDPGVDTAERLRIHIAQFAREIAGEADLDECIDDRAEGTRPAGSGGQTAATACARGCWGKWTRPC